MVELVVNADDFGLSPGVNEGVALAHEQGIVTSASLMVRQPAAGDAAAYALSHPGLAVGLHLDLGEWKLADDDWVAVYTWADVDDPAAVDVEVDRQLDAFHGLLGRTPTHLDSHQHVHRREPVRAALRRVAARLGVPLRHEGGVRYEGGFYGQTDDGRPLPELISVDRLVSLLNSLLPGVSELCCHPAVRADLPTAYASERLVETATLCDPRVRAAIDARGVRLLSFAEVPG